jgi:Domain of unknown function (DUF4157)
MRAPVAERGARPLTSLPVQAKLRVGAVNDPLEREADDVADRVMRLPGPASPLLQRCPGGCPGDDEVPPAEVVQRMPEEDLEPVVDARIQARRGLGRPLSPAERAFFEPRLGHDFGQVRVHTDRQAAELARSVRARAFTLGRDVFLGPGEAAPDQPAGRRLLAHELTHVVQQRHGGMRIQRAAELIPDLPSGCVATTVTDGVRTSSEEFDVAYRADEDIERAAFVEITLRQREDVGKEQVLHTQRIDRPQDEGGKIPREGKVTVPGGIPISNEKHYYELFMQFKNQAGVVYGGLGGKRPTVRFELCRLLPSPTPGWPLLFAKALYAEGVDAGEFPWVRDVVYNRIDWVKTRCPGDHRDFGFDIPSVLNAPGQFESVLENTTKFQELEIALMTQSGPCRFTTPPRGETDTPERCRLVNAAIEAQAAGDGNTHDHVFFRGDASLPSDRAVGRKQYPGGNYYWEISGCPEDRKSLREPAPWILPPEVQEPPR